ncbi:MAG: hypothetical protein LUD15_13935 [Bacteroides sp.]|nr:hypothetical protein [Bacteroides sp.]
MLFLAFSFFTGCSESRQKTFVDDDDYSVTAGFDTIQPGVTYGELRAIIYYSTTTENERGAHLILPPSAMMRIENIPFYIFCMGLVEMNMNG